MADTELPGPGGGGPKKNQWLWVGIAAAGGYVAYAWYKNRAAAAAPPTVTLNPNDVVPATDYSNPSPGGSSTVAVDSTGGVPTTNAAWTQAATTYLVNIGWDPALVSSALGKYLARTGLSAQEITAVQAAIGAEGYPPEGGPYPITAATAGTPDTFDSQGRDLGQYKYGADQVSYLIANIGKYGITQRIADDVQAMYQKKVQSEGKTAADNYHFTWIGPGNVQAIPK